MGSRMKSEKKYALYGHLSLIFFGLIFLPTIVQIIAIPFGVSLLNLIGKAEYTAITYFFFIFIFPAMYFIRKSVPPIKKQTKVMLDLKTVIARITYLVTLALSALLLLAIYIFIVYFWISPDLRFSDFPDSPFFRFIDGTSVVLSIILVISAICYVWWKQPKSQPKPETNDTPI